MPLLDTSTWFIMIVSTSLSLFIIMQLKISSHYYYSTPEPKMTKTIKPPTPWEVKGTKMYSPLLLPQR